jgi:hypothetical protein
VHSEVVLKQIFTYVLFTGLFGSSEDFIFFITILVLSSLVGSSMSFFFSSLFSVQAVASVCLALTLSVMVVITRIF